MEITYWKRLSPLEREAKWALQAKKKKARDAVYEALKKGKLTRRPCERCGDPKSQAHHPDHEKRLEVIWLCQKHHREADFA